MPLTAGIIGGVGAIGGGLLSFFGAQSQADAQARAAEAQAAEMRRQFEAALAERRREQGMALEFAAPSSVELQAQSNFLNLQEQILGRTKRELDFLSRGLDITSPGAAEAGRGLFSSMIMRGRAQQRAALESQLRQRFGAGYATTSAGQSALQQFDQGTVDVGVQAIPAFLGQAYQSIGAPVSLEQAIKNRQISAAQGTPVSPIFGQFAQQLSEGAAAPFLRQAQRGAMLSSIGSTVSRLGGMAFGQGLGGTFGMSKGPSASEYESNIDRMMGSMPSSGSFSMPTFGTFGR